MTSDATSADELILDLAGRQCRATKLISSRTRRSLGFDGARHVEDATLAAIRAAKAMTQVLAVHHLPRDHMVGRRAGGISVPAGLCIERRFALAWLAPGWS
jgi:hypothetical protein